LDVIKEVIPKYFKVVRGHLNNDNLTPFAYTGFAPSIGIDSVYLTKPKYIKKLLNIAQKTGSNLIFMCHSILPEEVKWENFGWGNDTHGVGWWRISPNTIQDIINMARKKDIEFYTTSEIAGVATFIDRNFEKCVRNLIPDSYTQWISISELSTIRELDLSNKGISNLDGIQYFLNLEKLNLSGNNICDLRLLDKLPKLVDINLTDNLSRNNLKLKGNVV
jgi:hypothetical protein